MDHFYKNEYENLRRKKNREIANLENNYKWFAETTYELLKGLGWKEEDIVSFYRVMKKKGQHDCSL